MSEMSIFTDEEQLLLKKKYSEVLEAARPYIEVSDISDIKRAFEIALEDKGTLRAKSGRHAIFRTLDIVLIVINEIGLGKTALICTFLYDVVHNNNIPLSELEKEFGNSVTNILKGLVKVSELYSRSMAIETDNFRKLLLMFAKDIRVVLIMIADRLNTMRHLQHLPEEDQVKIARETGYLYAPLAHRLGLYVIKSELEDLVLKFTSPDVYSGIAKNLNATKDAREAYIKSFIDPVKSKLLEQGLNFEIKGRTKTINSIYNKMVKKRVGVEGIFDLFAIRVVLDTDLANEKQECWKVYSIVTDMYAPNPKRLRDWLSIPKTNGYESLHTTVMGPEGKWVEVQIRSKRMNEVAEKGLAAHWRYKGIKSEKGLDEWLHNIRGILENPELNAVDFIDDFKLNLYDEEVFVFTPKGELRRLPKGATVLDFAFEVHTIVGSKCIGAIVNERNVPIRHVLQNGDQIEVLTSNNQKPKQDWLNVVTTSKAKTRIKQSLKEALHKEADLGRELLQRRFKNWKMLVEDSKIQRLVKKFKVKTSTDFYYAIAKGDLDINVVKEAYLDIDRKEQDTIGEAEMAELRTAGNFIAPDKQVIDKAEDVLTIDQNLKDIDYSLARCCNPIYGDDIFGFVASGGGIKIHRINCPNAPQMISRFGYRMVNAEWAGKAKSQYSMVLRVRGNDNISILSNISEVISKDSKIQMRSINIDSRDGIFEGNLAVFVNDLSNLKMLIKNIKNMKGIIDCYRIDQR